MNLTSVWFIKKRPEEANIIKSSAFYLRSHSEFCTITRHLNGSIWFADICALSPKNNVIETKIRAFSY